MKNRYLDLINQTFDFPQKHFEVKKGELYYHQIRVMDLIKKHGTPLKITYLPKIGEQINKAKAWFENARQKCGYKGSYTYCYCTKSSHFSFVVEEALKHEIHLETSSAYDINIVKKLEEKGAIDKTKYIIANGYKRPQYTEQISNLINQGFSNTIPILDNMMELNTYKRLVNGKCKLGIRIAAEEEPTFDFYTSRLGIRYNAIIDFYREQIQTDERFELKMLHFFINTGIKDSQYYWNELRKCVNTYCDLKVYAPHLDSLNIGGGLPIPNSLAFEYDYQYMIDEIMSQIKTQCNERGVEEPNIFTEFGSFTVGESGATFYSIIDQKMQNDREYWNLIDSSFITTLPDTWGISTRFIMLPINNWNKEYERVNLGGLTCDSMDYYNEDIHVNQIFLPKYKSPGDQIIGFFHTGAYQESVGGYGGLQHCLIPAPQHVIIDKNPEGKISSRVFNKEQTAESMLTILGY
jgi:arginine decarboxylase